MLKISIFPLIFPKCEFSTANVPFLDENSPTNFRQPRIYAENDILPPFTDFWRWRRFVRCLRAVLHDRTMSCRPAVVGWLVGGLLRQVKDTQIQLSPLFHDFDVTNNGAVTRSQFRRVLDTLKLAPYAPTQTEWLCIWDKYRALKGYRQDVNYIDFCDAIYDLAGYPYRSP